MVVGCVPCWADSTIGKIYDRLDFSGSKTYSLQSISVDGNRDMFFDDNYGFSPRYRNETNLTVTGNIITGLSVTATLSNNRWNPNDRNVALNYNRGRTKASLGDITASLTGNDLISFSKRLRGATVSRDFGFATVTALASRTKAATKTVTLTGNNTPGPYYLGASQIVDGSERVKIDEQEIRRSDESGRSNYTLDTYAGYLTFKDGLIVSSTSTVTVSFETQSYNSNPGTIWGFRSDVPVGKKTGIGLTYINQASNRESNQQRQITEDFHGNNSLSFPYEMLYIPLEGSVIVKVDGVVQPPGTYSVNYPLHYIMFPRPIPFNSTVLVTYIPKPQNEVSGDRSVMGVDMKMKVSDNLTLTGEMAKSTRDYTGQNSGGAATSLKAVGKYGKLDLTANVRSIDRSFAPIETAGFFRSERGANLDLKYSFNSDLKAFTRLERFKRPDYRSFNSSASASGTLTTTQSVSGFEWKRAKLPQVRLTRTSIDSSNGSGWEDSLASTALSVYWESGRFGANGEISRQERGVNSLSLSDGSNIFTNSTSNTSRIALRYNPGNRMSLNADLSSSKISGGNGPSTDAKNYQLSARFAPARTVHLSANYRVSDSGGRYFSPYGGGIGGIGIGTGFGAGYPTSGYVPSYGMKSITRSLNVDWTPSTRLSFNTGYNYSLYSGDNTTNTSTTGMDFGFSFTPSDLFSFRGLFNVQDGSFTGSGGDMSSRIGFLSASIGPLKKFRLDLNYQKMLSGTTLPSTMLTGLFNPYQDTSVDMQSLSARLAREIGGGRNVFTEYSTSAVTGMIGNTKSVFAVGMEYPLNEILGLTVDWRLIDYKDTHSSASNYHASMLNARIGARFR
ncbi:MAG: hypothetical protein HYX78_10685 [Armatimonadetes bacterium]|nr:hypothetical protein [Armatimonadota bacterium]